MAAHITRFCRYCGRINTPLRATLLSGYLVCRDGCCDTTGPLEKLINDYLDRDDKRALRVQLMDTEKLLSDASDALARARVEARWIP
jgi:hypothetical protein